VHSKRSYGDGCGIAHALDLIGDRWALLIVRDLLLGPKRFTDLQAGLRGAGPTILGQRLRDLERVGVVRRRTLPAPAASKVYELTEWGARLDPILIALGRWGIESPVVEREGGVGADSVMLSLRSSFREQGDWNAMFDIDLDGNHFTVCVVDGHLTDVARGQGREQPDATIETDTATLDALIGGGQTLPAALDAGLITVTGDADAARRLMEAVRN
jgi:DNA-binding HxlR family transcriptional regulator